MKKRTIVAICVLLCVLMTVFSFAACQKPLPTYYGKTYTVTGAGLAVDWDAKIWIDPMISYEADETIDYYSTRELLGKYWDDIDWEANGITEIPKDVDGLISYLETEVIPEFHNYMKGLQIKVGTKDNLTITITYPEDRGFGEAITIDKINENMALGEGTSARFSYSVLLGGNTCNFVAGSIDTVNNFDGKESLLFHIPWDNVDNLFLEANPSNNGYILLKPVEVGEDASNVYSVNYLVYPELTIE